ncbi:MAG: hypothetical protein MJK14_20985 [Rivularia sp. ALOHA_DT_140]|nr:hypothetical protein [Rivularia sp. ALOHA_DT_140]
MLKNTRLKFRLTKVFPFFGGVVLSTAAILAGAELIHLSSNSHNVPNSSIVLTLFYHSRQRKNRNPNNPTD